MTPRTIVWDEPQELNAEFFRDTTPRVEFRFFESVAIVDGQPVGVGPVDVTAYTFEVHFKESYTTENADATLSYADADLVKNPEVGQINVLQIPISRADTLNAAKLPSKGIWVIYRTDADGRRVRIVNGGVVMRP